MVLVVIGSGCDIASIDVLVKAHCHEITNTGQWEAKEQS